MLNTSGSGVAKHHPVVLVLRKVRSMPKLRSGAAQV